MLPRYHSAIIDNIVKAFCRKQWVITERHVDMYHIYRYYVAIAQYAD